ncbi:MAG TPA: DUF935 domain-containing protein [Methylocystis sp.]|jgi:phage gp29-like protein
MREVTSPPEAQEDQIGMHGPSLILGPDGQPLRRSIAPSDRRKLSEEEARPELAGVRSFWQQSVASGLTPERLANVLETAKRGDHRLFLELAEEMEERDDHYYSVLSTRRLALSGISVSIDEEASEDVPQDILDAVEELFDDEFPDVVEDAMDALGKGYSCIEMLWGERGGLWKPQAFIWRDPKYFTFDYISRSELRLARLGTMDGDPLPPAKFITHIPRLKAGVPIRGGFGRMAAWSFIFKNYSIKDWAAFLDIYGMPIRLGKYHPGATNEERRKLLQAVMNIASDAAAIIPETMAIELLESKGASGGTTTPFEALGRYLDEQMSKRIIGQTLTADKGGSLAQAKVHNQVRIDILRADARQLAKTLNRDLVSWFVRLNWGDDAPMPKVHLPVAEPEDIAVLATAISQLVPVGLRVKQAEVREKLGLSEPDEKDELLAPQKAAPETPAPGEKQKPDPQTKRLVREAALNLSGGCPCCGTTERVALNAESAGDDPSAELIDEAADDWEPVMGPIEKAVAKALDESDSFEAFKAKLTALVGTLDTGKLAKRVALQQMKARGLGNG